MAKAKTDGKSSGKAGTIIAMAVLTVLALGAGGLVGKLIGAQGRKAVPAAVPPAVAEKAQPYSDSVTIRELPPILANLAAPKNTVVRLQAAIVLTKKPEDNAALLTAKIGDDLIAYLKTVSLTQLQGASGLQNLKEDLNERAAIRSQGSVREVIIEALVAQ